MFRLNRPEIQDNERKRIGQLLTHKTKLESYSRCMVCKKLNRRTVRGHSVPRNWLKQISSPDEEVLVFVTLPVSPLPKDLEIDGDLIAVPTKPLHINNVHRRRFTCETHEKMFFPIDGLNPDTTSLWILNLMAYKAIIAESWTEAMLEEAHRAALAETPDDEVFRLQARLHHQNGIGLEHYKNQVEECLQPGPCNRCNGSRCKMVSHVVRHTTGAPTLAVSQFSSGSRTEVNPVYRTFKYIANWGLTVLPRDEGHTVILHYFPDELKDSEMMAQAVSDFSSLNGRRLQEFVSMLILDSCENFAISLEAWEKYGPKRRAAIERRLGTELQDVGFGSMAQIKKWDAERLMKTKPSPPSPKQLNLFPIEAPLQIYPNSIN